MNGTGGVLTAPRARGRLYYGWVVLAVAAAAMVGTLPGRTQGLGLITEPLLRDVGISRVAFAQINLVATLVGALFCFGIGRLIDRIGSRPVLTSTAIALGVFAGGVGTAGASPWDIPDVEVAPCVLLPQGCEPAPEPEPEPDPGFDPPFDDIVVEIPCWTLDTCPPGDPNPEEETPEETPETPETTPDGGGSPSGDSSVQTAAPAVVVNASPNFTG